MKQMIALMALLGLAFALAGCSEKAAAVESEVMDAALDAGSIAAEELGKAEAEAEALGGEAAQGIEAVVADIEDKAAIILSELKVDGKAELAVLAQDERTVKYEFTVLTQDAETEAAALEKKVAEAESKFAARVAELKEQGIADAKVVVSFIGAEGQELYRKVFG